MIYNQYTRQSPPVSQIGMGTWQLGVNSGWKNMSQQDAVKMVHMALDYGVNFFDTAPNYGNGTSELRLGKALKGYDRDKIIVNTKFGHTDLGELNYNSNFIRKSLEASLQRLKLDFVDSLIIHNPPFNYLNGHKNDHYEILEKLKEEGKIRAYGASLDTYEEMKLFMETTNSEVIEVFFNVLHQDTSKAFDMALKKKMAIIVKIPLDSGWLTGKYNAESMFNDIRKRWTTHDIRTRSILLQKLKKIIGQKRQLSQTAIAFCASYDAVATVIPGSIRISQLENNIESSEKQISTELVRKLEEFYELEVKKLRLPW